MILKLNLSFGKVNSTINLPESKSNKQKCRILNLKRNNPRHNYMLRATQLESRFAEKYLEVLVDITLNMSQQCALATKKAYSPFSACEVLGNLLWMSLLEKGFGPDDLQKFLSASTTL